jgi:hypothetical protein
MNWKGCGMKWLWHNFKVLSQHLPGGTEKTTKDLSQDNRFLSQDLNLGPEYEERVTVSDS